MRTVFVLLLVILATTLYMRKQPPSFPRPENPVILAFGDSLTYGYGTRDPAHESYPARLATLTGQAVVNAGVNGETSAEGLRRIDALLERYRPGVTILWLGGNDILRRISPQETRSNLRRMIEKIQAVGSIPLLVAVPDLGLLGPKDLSLYEELAQEMSIPLVSEVLGPILEEPALKSDPIHPNARGYEIIAQKIYEAMRRFGLLSSEERP